MRLDNDPRQSAATVTQAMQEHLVVLDALRAHDSAAAVAAMEDHLRRALHRAIGFLNTEHGASSPMPKITKVEFTSFAYKLEGLTVDEGHNTVYKPGGVVNCTGLAVRIFDSDGVEGCFVYPSPESAMVAQAKSLAQLLIGRDPNAREKMYDDIKRIMRKLGAFGYSPLDIALWDMAGKRFGASITTLLGGYRENLPTYASTFHGDRNGGLSSKEAFADYAEYCYGLGFRAFKIHGWTVTDRREEAANVLHVAAKVGHKMDLMLDPACELRTFADALYVGRACDEAKFFWFEDPFRDGGFSRHAYRKLRQMLKTPLLIGEHVRGLEAKADFIEAEATDFVRANPMLDMGITGVMKIAHLAEAHGLDVETARLWAGATALHGGNAKCKLL